MEEDFIYVKFENLSFLITAIFYLIPISGAIYRILKYSQEKKKKNYLMLPYN